MRKIIISILAVASVAFIYSVYRSESRRLSESESVTELVKETEKVSLGSTDLKIKSGMKSHAAISENKSDPSIKFRSNVTYSILKIGPNNTSTFSISIRIQEKLPSDQLTLIAEEVVSQHRMLSNTGVIFFLLPEMKLDNGAWAAVDFLPEPKPRILGQSILDEEQIKSGLSNTEDYVGLWTDNSIQGDVLVRIRKSKNVGFVFEYISASNPKPSEYATPLKRVFQRGKMTFKDLGESGEYYVIESNGNLSVYGSDGYVETLQKLKYKSNN